MVLTAPPLSVHVPTVAPPLVVRVTEPVAAEGETEMLTLTAAPWVEVAGVTDSDVEVASGAGVPVPPVQAFTRFATFTDPSPVAES